jgi:hypothetical protein
MRKYKWKLKNIIMIIKYIWACFSVSLSFYKYWNWNTIAEKNLKAIIPNSNDTSKLFCNF